MNPAYRRCRDFLYGRNQFAMKLGLDNIRRLLNCRGIRPGDMEIIHVAGTNGKGSVCRYLAELLRAQTGGRVGLYTSPHLVSFRERIEVNGTPVSRRWMAEWFHSAGTTAEALGATYFECATAMALEYFQSRRCRVAVLETGLGGRLDATNAVQSDLCLLTPVALDHTHILGGNVEAIWNEKLGILKPGVGVAVVERRESLLRALHGRAVKLGSPVWNFAEAWDGGSVRLQPKGRDRWVYHSDMGRVHISGSLKEGSTLAQSLGFAIWSLERWRGAPLGVGKPARPLRLPEMTGRQQVLTASGKPAVFLDVAHNPAAVAAMTGAIRALWPRTPKIFLFAVMGDKDFTAMARLVEAVGAEYRFFEMPDLDRALKWPAFAPSVAGGSWSPMAWSREGWFALREHALRRGAVLVFFGSIYWVGRAIPVLMGEYPGLERFSRFKDELFEVPGIPIGPAGIAAR